MARRARVEFKGAVYHVLNRGNYRDAIFRTEGARHSFLNTFWEACRAADWIVFAWCLMPNHYHLCLETPRGNLVRGMTWLSSTFANRFNRFRRENGHVFQGRYKAILVRPAGLVRVCDYIHLNPVRSGLTTTDELSGYRDNSLGGYLRPGRRHPLLRPERVLQAATGQSDSLRGRRAYLAHLKQVLASERGLQLPASPEAFPETYLTEKEWLTRTLVPPHPTPDADHGSEGAWEACLTEALNCLNQSPDSFSSDSKGAPWKIAVARLLREQHLAPYTWIARHLHMGTTSYAQMLVSRHQRETFSSGPWDKLKHLKKAG